MNEEKIGAELKAVQMLLLSIVNTHPQKDRLLADFDALIANVQMYSVQEAGRVIPHDLREALERLRDQLATTPR